VQIKETKAMLNLHVVQADLGDCLLLEYKENEQGASKFILVDGGPTDTYTKHLKHVLKEKVGEGGHLDLAVVSHIDNDHICGMIRFLQFLKQDKMVGKPPSTRVDALWHNTLKQNIGIESPNAAKVLMLATEAENLGLLIGLPMGTERGFGEDETLTKLADHLGIWVNPGFTDKIILSESAPAPWKMGKLRTWILGPDRSNLEKLQGEWSEWLQNKVKAPVRGAIESRAPKLSSIILLLEEEGGRKILLPGDGTGEEILNGLRALGKLDADGRFHVDVLKLPHHGSERNVSKAFFEKVSADVYVISAKGTNPARETLEWIAESASERGRSIQILATNEITALPDVARQYVQVAELGSHYFSV
jgi:beta-lactamase superfamily II metal-dependent hydrolase